MAAASASMENCHILGFTGARCRPGRTRTSSRFAARAAPDCSWRMYALLRSERSRSNCHPFAIGRHLSMHNGQIGRYRCFRHRIDAPIPDDRYPLRRGTSDSQALFLAAIGRGLDRDPMQAIAATLVATLTEMAEARIADPPRLSVVHSDRETLRAILWAGDRRCPIALLAPVRTGRGDRVRTPRRQCPGLARSATEQRTDDRSGAGVSNRGLPTRSLSAQWSSLAVST